MCRIIGAIGKELDSPFITNVFLESEHLGKDATGFWFPNTGIIKGPKKVSEFLPEAKEKFEEGINNSHVFIGHTRYATHGKPEHNYNNHPIESENWIIVHNGIVGSMKDIDEYSYVSDTDTENILAYIETFGLEEGLEYCSGSASIILVNKSEENTIYLWKTMTSDMSIGYDFDKENIYISSGDKYFWKALQPELEKIDRMDGLFNVLKRRMKVTEPETRQLWKISYKDELLSAKKLKTVPQKYIGNYCGGSYHWNKTYDKKDPNEDLFVTIRRGKNRPRVKEGRIKVYKNNNNTTTTTVTKKGNDLPKLGFKNETINKGDVVKLIRNPIGADIIYGMEQGTAIDLTTEMQFVVLRTLRESNRIAIRRESDKKGFVVPRYLLELVENPVCMGIFYNEESNKCKTCLFKEGCEEVYDLYDDMEKPQCLGFFSKRDEKCTVCSFLVHCLSFLSINRREEAGEYIDAEFTEANSTIVEGN